METFTSLNTRHSHNTTVVTMSIWTVPRFANIHAGTALFQYSYWNCHRVSHHAKEHATAIQSVSLNKIWEEREKSGIWLSVVGPVSLCPKAIVRRHHVRRLRAALATVFNEHGLDRHGKVMEGRTSSFQGTLHVILNRPIIRSKGSRIRLECAKMVHKLVESYQQGRNLGEGLNHGYKKTRQFESASSNQQLAGFERAFNNELKAKPTFKRLNLGQTREAKDGNQGRGGKPKTQSIKLQTQTG